MQYNSNDGLNLNDCLARDRTALANERTLLAYIRTFIGMVGAGVGMMIVVQLPFAQPTGIAFITAGCIILVAGVIRFFQTKRKIKMTIRAELLEDEDED